MVDNIENHVLEESSPLLSSAAIKSKLLNNSQLFLRSVGFALNTGICGLAMTSYGDNIEGLAANVGLASIQIGGVFLMRGAGNIVGSLIYPELSSNLTGTVAISIFTVALMCIFVVTPFCTSVVFLYFIYFVLGISMAVVDTGSMTVLRKMHTKEAGPWLSASFLFFSVSGAVSALLRVISVNVIFNFMALAVIVSGIQIYFTIFGADVEGHIAEKDAEQKLIGGNKLSENSYYFVEWFGATALCFSIGCSATVNSYLNTYVDETGIISAQLGTVLLFAFWLSLIGSRAVLIFVQSTGVLSHLTQISRTALYLYGVCILSCVAVLIFDDFQSILWIAVILLGFCVGPAGGLLFDLTNKLEPQFGTYSTTILMLGINVGNTLAYACSAVWSYSNLGPSALFWSVLGMLVIATSALIVLTYDRLFSDAESVKLC